MRPRGQSQSGSFARGSGECTGDNVVGGEWEYNCGFLYNGFTQGISSTGLDLFGSGTLFPGIDLSNPEEVNGGNYGITSYGDDFATSSGGLQGPLTKDTVQFRLTAWAV
jgi:hypothetical protein